MSEPRAERQPILSRRKMLARGTAACLAGVPLTRALAQAPTPEYPPFDPSPICEQVRSMFKLPALAVGVVRPKGPVSVGIAGLTADGRGAENPIPTSALFSVGPATWCINTTIVARLLHQGQLKWKTTLRQALPDLVDGMSPPFRNVTIGMLMLRAAGIPEQTAFRAIPTPIGQPPHRLPLYRKEMAKLVLSRPPAFIPGSRAGDSELVEPVLQAVVEGVTGRRWEVLTRWELFDALPMERAGFGPAATRERPLEPRTYTVDGMVELAPAPFTGPIHAQLGGLGLFVQMHLRGLNNRVTLLAPRMIQRLHTPSIPGDDVSAMGWRVETRDGTKVHEWLGAAPDLGALFQVVPSEEFALVAVSTRGETELALRQVAETVRKALKKS